MSEEPLHTQNESTGELVEKFCEAYGLELSEQIHKLSEESGEVSGAYLAFEGKQRFNQNAGKTELAKEVAQVVYTAWTIAHIADFDMEYWLRVVAEENSLREET